MVFHLTITRDLMVRYYTRIEAPDAPGWPKLDTDCSNLNPLWNDSPTEKAKRTMKARKYNPDLLVYIISKLSKPLPSHM